jgi:hypothetical protein
MSSSDCSLMLHASLTRPALCVLQDPDKLIKGDPAVEEIFKWGDKMRIPYRGASGLGDAVHQVALTPPLIHRSDPCSTQPAFP